MKLGTSIIKKLLNGFRPSKKEEKDRREPYANEEVAKIPKEKMMERIANVVKAESEKEKGRDEGYI